MGEKCPKCLGNIRFRMADHDQTSHPATELVIPRPGGRPGTFRFHDAEILDVAEIAKTPTNGIFAIHIRANADPDGHWCTESTEEAH